MSGPSTAKVANKFDLSGNGTTIGYSIGMDGKPALSIDNMQFSGNQIRTEHGELGDLVSVHVKEGVEGQYTSATVLIPGIDLGNDNSQPLTTMVIMSPHRGMDSPRHGQLQDYVATMLKGTASHIETVTGGARR
jgi:hypothetical protein